MYRGISRGTTPLVLSTFACFLGTGATLAVLPLHVLNVLNAGGFLLGLVLGIFSFAALIGRLLGGWCADVMGRPRTAYFSLLAVSATAFLLCLPLTTFELLMVRFFQGLTQGALSVAVITWMMDISNDGDRAMSLTFVGAGVWGGTTLGVLVGGLANSLSFSGLISGLSALIMIPTLRFATAPPSLVFERIKRTFLPKSTLVPSSIFALGTCAYSAIAGFVVLHMNSQNASGVVVLTTFSFIVLFGRFLVVPLASHFGLQRSVRLALISATIGLVIVAYSTTTSWGVAGVFLIAIAHSTLWPALGSLVASRASNEERGSALGFMTGMYDAAVGISSFFFGLLADHYNTKIVFLVATLFMMVGIVFDSAFSKKPFK